MIPASLRRASAVVAALVSISSCASILGDDFSIESDEDCDDGECPSTSNGPAEACEDQYPDDCTNCGTCALQNACSEVYLQCNNSQCSDLVNCLANGDAACTSGDCAACYPEGVEPLHAMYACLCGECSSCDPLCE